ncbi:hypothetical protein CDAR_500211 [Caerostris darwini]|uniref:Uncharacterized protein n=1 Tax=Caerostris darwini TaxID=1538125 RepID=A0AAV4M8L7_9ARAC|nr:hypothetical protein CDAR_500211 [Caerostris darwini]
MEIEKIVRNLYTLFAKRELLQKKDKMVYVILDEELTKLFAGRHEFRFIDLIHVIRQHITSVNIDQD